MAGSSKRDLIMAMPTEFSISDVDAAGIYPSGTMYQWRYRNKFPPYFMKNGTIFFKRKDFLQWDETRPDRRTLEFKAGRVKK